MIYKANTKNETVKQFKKIFGLTGDVYVINEHLIESLASHKKMYPDSTASTIQEAEQERLQKIEEEKAMLKEESDLHQSEE